MPTMIRYLDHRDISNQVFVDTANSQMFLSESPGCNDDAEESINAALIEEQNTKLNQIASEERSGLSSAQTENPVLSALADRLQEINLRVGRLQEASAVTARKSGGNYSNRRGNVFKCFYCGIQGHRQAECRKRQRDERAARYQPPRRNAASEYSSSSSPRPGGRHVHFRESTLRDNYAAPRHSSVVAMSKSKWVTACGSFYGGKEGFRWKTIGGKGRLTDAIISKLTTFYGNAIRANSHNVNEMRQAV
ncbi:hypothetical protein TNCV_3575941 [Trichonephila clavipes]|nr:hypothetical protein TNCV_3575941 [Trichonephila clavipes]